MGAAFLVGLRGHRSVEVDARAITSVARILPTSLQARSRVLSRRSIWAPSMVSVTRNWHSVASRGWEYCRCLRSMRPSPRS
jgi:hypothetical protein